MCKDNMGVVDSTFVVGLKVGDIVGYVFCDYLYLLFHTTFI